MTDRRYTTVLHVITALNYGGAEGMLAKLVTTIRESEQQRHIVVSMLPPGVIGRQLAAQGIAVHTLGMTRGWPGVVGLWRLLRLVRRVRPDIIQGWMYHGNIAAWAARLLAGRRAVLGWNVRHSLYDPAREERRTALAIRLSARLSRHADFVIFNSRVAIAEHAAVGFDCRVATVIPNGFDTAAFRPDPAGLPQRAALLNMLPAEPAALIIGMVARVHPMKDHANLFRALSIVRDAGHDVRLVLAGAGTEALTRLPADALSALPSDRVSLLGDRRDVAQWLAGLDIAVLSSAWGEGFPNAVGEAMAAAVPCVVTDVGDCRDIVGEGGLTVPPGDPAALAAALVSLIETGPSGRKAIGAAGRQRVQELYGLDRIVARYAEVYRGWASHRAFPAIDRAPSAEPSCAG